MPARSICWAATGAANNASADAHVTIAIRDEPAVIDPPLSEYTGPNGAAQD
jgi:hypothetical protein